MEVEARLLNIDRHRSLFLIRSALKPRQNHYVGMATHQCRLKMMLDSGG